jgi:hypothetical protein
VIRALVSGALAHKSHNAGNAWSRSAWVTGLRRLGITVSYVEQIERPTSEQVAWFESALGSVGVDGWLVSPDGPLPDEAREAAAAADFLLNIGGHLTRPELFAGPRHRVYLDDDPGYTQYWHASGSEAARLGGHDVFFTFGANIGRARCPIPTGEIEWRATRPPVVIDDWPVVSVADDTARFTTVATWRSPYGRLRVAGGTLGMKLDEFRRFVDLPSRCSQHFEVALDIHPAEASDLELLSRHRWKVVDPRTVAGTLDSYRSYVQQSGAEFSPAQSVYVETDSGWFSDRTARYLASGKPVLVQETGFRRTLPTGEGLLSFSTLAEAAAGAEQIAAGYDAHASAARALAAEYFDSDRVVAALLEDTLA